MLRCWPNAWIELPHLGSVIVTAMLGIALFPALRTAITMRVCSASRWETGNLAVVTWTGKTPEGSAAFCAAWPPHADTNNVAAIAARVPQLLDLRPLTAR